MEREQMLSSSMSNFNTYNMSQTVINEIEKAKILAKGLRSKISEVKNLNITDETIKLLETTSQTLHDKNKETELLHEELRKKIAENNTLLADLKQQMLELRKNIKGHYPIEKWILFGVQDKR